MAPKHAPQIPAGNGEPDGSRGMFPAIEPYETGHLAVDGLHRVYWEQSGNPDGVPVVFLHGGPGAGTAPVYRRFFDPEHYRIILFDQRGAGRSTPLAEVVDNTTAHLVADMECLREHLNIRRWLLFGGSWGSTLALAYGQTHPRACLGFILRGVFLFRRREVDWFLHGMRRFFPEAWDTFAGFLPETEREDLLGSYHRRLMSPEPGVHMPAARAWCAYEESCSRLLPRTPENPGPGSDPASLATARLEAHYMVNAGFLPEGRLLENMAVLSRHPAAIVQGRYDLVCPPETAAALARSWPNAAFTIVPDAGHSAMEPGIRAALVEATQRFRKTLRSERRGARAAV